MSKTFKDASRQKTHKTALEIVANGDGTYEITLNQKLVGTRIKEHWLNAELCGKYGFCGGEFDEILRQLTEHGRASIIL